VSVTACQPTGVEEIETDLVERFPALADWMASVRPGHPLQPLISADTVADPGSVAGSCLAAFDTIITRLNAAAPQRLSTERSEFRAVKTFDDLLIVRAELVAGSALAARDVGFDFGKRGSKPEPDLVLRGRNLGIEVKARRLDGLQNLVEEMKTALTALTWEGGAAIVVFVACHERPLYLKPARRAEIINGTLQRIRSGAMGSLAFEVEQPWATSPRLTITVRFLPQPADVAESSVVVEGGWELTSHLSDVESEVIAVLNDPQKVAQANAMPTILLVDAARTGLSWIRPPSIWARRLADRLPAGTSFVGVAVMIPTLDSPDVAIALALQENLPTQQMADINALTDALGMMQQ
jgi:hypothetical protein